MLLSNLSPESGWIRMNIYENQKPWEFEPYDPEKHGDWNTYQMLKFDDYVAWREFHGEPFGGEIKR